MSLFCSGRPAVLHVLLILATVGPAPSATAQEIGSVESTVVFLVRHAEKEA